MVGGWRHRSQLNTLVWMLFKVLWAVSYLKGLSVIAFIAPGLFAHSCPGTHTHTWRDIHKILLKLTAQKINGSWDLIQKLKVGRRLATLNWFKRNTGRY